MELKIYHHVVRVVCDEQRITSPTYRWFEGFDWVGLQKQTVIPPIIPHVSRPRYSFCL